ncbi:hypothetical protein GQX74_000612 [Glossina fuscipes]|nr:hypothetical protein GQX74_000612 [Glossina fuscipes]
MLAAAMAIIDSNSTHHRTVVNVMMHVSTVINAAGATGDNNKSTIIPAIVASYITINVVDSTNDTIGAIINRTTSNAIAISTSTTTITTISEVSYDCLQKRNRKLP